MTLPWTPLQLAGLAAGAALWARLVSKDLPISEAWVWVFRLLLLVGFAAPFRSPPVLEFLSFFGLSFFCMVAAAAALGPRGAAAYVLPPLLAVLLLSALTGYLQYRERKRERHAYQAVFPMIGAQR